MPKKYKKEKQDKGKKAPHPVEVRGVVGQQPPYLARASGMPPTGPVQQMARPFTGVPMAQFENPVPGQVARPSSLPLITQEYISTPPVPGKGLRRMDSPISSTSGSDYSMGTPNGSLGQPSPRPPQNGVAQRSPMPSKLPGSIFVMPTGSNWQRPNHEPAVSQVLEELDDTLRQFEEESIEKDLVQSRAQLIEPPPDYDMNTIHINRTAPAPYYQQQNRPSSRSNSSGHPSVSSNDSTPNSSTRQPARNHNPQKPYPFQEELLAKMEQQSQLVPDVSGQYGRGRDQGVPIKKTHMTIPPANARNMAKMVSSEFASKQMAKSPEGSGRTCWGRNCQDPANCNCRHRQLQLETYWQQSDHS